MTSKTLAQIFGPGPHGLKVDDHHPVPDIHDGQSRTARQAMIYTVPQLAAELGVTRARVHQLIIQLGLHPERLGGTGPFMLTGRDRRRLLDRKPGKPGRPEVGA